MAPIIPVQAVQEFPYYYNCYESCWSLVLRVLGFVYFFRAQTKPKNIESTPNSRFNRRNNAQKEGDENKDS